MVWPELVSRQFQYVPASPLESDFHGAYSKLFGYLLPYDTPYTIIARYLEPASEPPVMVFEVYLENGWPLFTLQLNGPADLHDTPTRVLADGQIRRRLRDLAGDCPIPKLHGISAMGTRLCFYTMDVAAPDRVIKPVNIPQHPPGMIDMVAPATRWDCDIMDAQGEARLRAVLDEIKRACKKLDW